MARTRTTYQRGSLVPYRGKLQLRYREWDAARGRWLNRRKIMINPNTKSPFTVEGSPPRIPKQAQALADALMAGINQRNNAPPVSNDSLTLSQFLASTWEDYLDEHNVQASTRSTYRSMLDARILPAFGERELSKITPVDLSRFIAKIKTSPRHRLNLYSLLRTIFRVAFEHDLITTSPVREIHRPAYTREPKPVLTPEQIHKLMLEIPAPYRLLFTLIALTGIRISEALALCWEDFNPQTSTLQIASALYHKQRKAPKTRSTVRPLHLPPSLVSALADHRRVTRFCSPTDFIFCRGDGEPFEQSGLRRRVLHPAMDRAGIPRARFTHGFHLFRHSAGTNLYLLKRDLQLVKDHLGHASIQTTSDIYLHTEHATTTDTTSTLAEVIELERLLESSLVN